jgi:hypothetical protein
MKEGERMSGFKRARNLPGQVSDAVDDIKTAADSVRTSTDALVLILGAIGIMTACTLVLVIGISVRGNK